LSILKVEEGLLIKTVEIQRQGLAELGLSHNSKESAVIMDQGQKELGLVKEADVREEEEEGSK